jgi:predicted proteasome-type protease
VDETKNAVENIETTVVRTQGNIADLQTDIPSLIERRHSETQENLHGIKTLMQKNYELIEQTLAKMQERNEAVIKQMQDDSTSDEVRQMLKNQSDILMIVQTVVTNNHKLLEAYTIPAAPPIKPITNVADATESSTP